MNRVRFLFFAAGLGALLGLVIGVWHAWSFVGAQNYWTLGLRWVAVRAFLDSLLVSIPAGGSLVLAAGALFLLLLPPLRRWIEDALRPEASGAETAVLLGVMTSALTSLALLGSGIYILNTEFVTIQRSTRSVILHAGLLGVIAAVFVWLTRVMTHVAKLPRRGRALGRAGAAALAVSAVVWTGSLVAGQLLRPSPPAGAGNIILLSVETLRADHLTHHGYRRATSPSLARWIREGRTFYNCYAHAPTTTSALASLLSGLLPRQTGTYEVDPLPERVPTLMEQLQNVGYTTIAVVSNWALREGSGFEHGFDLFDDEMDPEELERPVIERTAEGTESRALELLEEGLPEPFFLWVHYQDPHGPYTPPPPHRDVFLADVTPGRRLRISDSTFGYGGIPTNQVLGNNREYGYYVAQYDGEIRYFDQSVGELLRAITNAGLRDRSLIFFTADHGEALGENEFYFNHGHFLYKSLLHVPLTMWGPPGTVTPGVSDSTWVQHLDFTPTVLDFAGLDPLVTLAGRSLLAEGLTDAEIFSEARSFQNYRCSLISRGMSLAFDSANGSYSFTDFATDDTLDARRTPQDPERMKEIVQILRNRRPRSTRSQDIGKETEERLRSLGYIR